MILKNQLLHYIYNTEEDDFLYNSLLMPQLTTDQRTFIFRLKHQPIPYNDATQQFQARFPGVYTSHTRQENLLQTWQEVRDAWSCHQPEQGKRWTTSNC